MIQEKSNYLNDLISIEEELQVLWKFHPDNKDAVDVESRFNELQSNAASIQNYLQTLWSVKD